MINLSSSDRMGEAVARALRHWTWRGKGEGMEVSRPPAGPPPWTVAISRQAGSDAPAVTGALAQKLGWPVYDRKLIEKIAGEMGLHIQLVESVDERKRGWLEECMHSFSSQPGVSESSYVRHLARVLFSLAALGDCIIVGRGAAQVLPEETTLRVRLVGPKEDRIESIRRRKGMSHQEARRWVDETEKGRARFVREHFLRDPDDPAGYDLVLNSAQLGPDTCAELILTALRRLQKAAAAKQTHATAGIV